jgi:uncharacterized protein with HEPN domain
MSETFDSVTFDKEIVLDMLRQVAETLERIQHSFSPITQADDFYASDEGLDKLDAICMKLLVVGEILKKIDRKTDKALFVKYNKIDWTGFIGLRDVIAHDYYNLNPVKIFEICSQEIEPLRETISQIIDSMSTNQ